MQIVDFPKDSSAVSLAENFLEIAKRGDVQWVAMVIADPHGGIRFEWSMLPNTLAAVGAIEALKLNLISKT